MLTIFKKMTIPYSIEEWYLNLINALPKVVGGLLLTFCYSPRNMGVPWNSSFNDLPAFRIAPEFLSTVQGFGSIFSAFPSFFAAAAAFSMFFGGICLIIGCCTRLASLLIFLVMLTTLLFREFDLSWSYIPTCAFLSISILGIWFGSGRLGLDYLISKKLNWV
jgi:putative oxidoreductase